MSERPQIAAGLEPDEKSAIREAVGEGLRAHNTQATGDGQWNPISLALRAPDGEILGGLVGGWAWGWLYVSMLWVREDRRGQGWGRALMERAEREAAAGGCHGAHLDTFSFQARGLYESLGYEVFGALEDYPPGHQRFYMRKRLER